MHLTAGEKVDGLALYRSTAATTKRKVRGMLMLASVPAAQLGDAK